MDSAIELKALSMRFGDVEALRALSFTVPVGGVFGFLGVNGSGKTTAIRILNGFLKPTIGETFIFGKQVSFCRNPLSSRIGYLPQEHGFFSWMTGREYLMFSCSLFGMPNSVSAAKTSMLLDRCGLTKAANRKIGGWSTGMKQRLGIAQSLVNSPDLLIFDEPVSSLDPLGRLDVLSLISELSTEHTVFMSSHILNDIERVCDNVAIIHNGSLITCEQTKRLTERFITPIFEIALSGDTEPFAQTVRSLDFVSSVSAVKQHLVGVVRLRIAVTDIERGRLLLPTLISQAGLSLIAYEQVMPTLEDVFLRLVSNNESGDCQ